MMPLPACYSLPLSGLPHVFVLSTKPKMGRLNANGSVAGVQNFILSRERPIKNSIRNSVCPDISVKSSVAVISQSSSPVPTFISRWRITRHEPPEGFLFAKAARLVGFPSKGIAVNPPAAIVSAAPCPGPGGPIAFRDRAFHSLMIRGYKLQGKTT